MDGPAVLSMPPPNSQKRSQSSPLPQPHAKPNQVSTVSLYGIHIVSLVIEGQERLCLAQISNTLLKQFSYNEIHNRRVALGITCVQCTPVQLEILRRAGAMPPSSRRCGMITRREAERLCKSFLSDNAPPRLPDDFAFSVHHECGWGCRGAFLPSRYNSSRAKCIKCAFCGLFFSPNKFIFHSHQSGLGDKFIQPDAANFNSWRRHMKLSGNPPDDVVHAWEDVKAMFNGGTRKRLLSNPGSRESLSIFNGGNRKRILSNPGSPGSLSSPKQLRTSPTTPIPSAVTPSITSNTVSSSPHSVDPRVPPFHELPLPLPRSLVMNYMWHQHQQAAAAVAATKTPGFAFSPYTLPWLTKHGPVLFSGSLPSPLSGTTTNEPLMAAVSNSPIHQSAFRPVVRPSPIVDSISHEETHETIVEKEDDDTDDEVDIETTEDDDVPVSIQNLRNNNSSASNNSGTLNANNSRNNSSPQCWSPPRETVSLKINK
ncbi:hypothetical protein PV326_007466 [Microctonus aethiopoides]|nr:hypothetical protein PV326_007466 [Microctonus aethiopoides]